MLVWMCLLSAALGLQGQVSGSSATPPARTVAADVARLKELLYQRDRAAEQSQAALLLVQSAAPEAQAAVREGLRRHDRPDVFQAIAAALRIWRDERLIPLLLQALANDQASIRQPAIDALAAQNPKVLTRWVSATVEDGTASLQARLAAVQVLGRCMHKGAVTELIRFLASDSPAIRQAAAAALQEISGQPLGPDIIQWQNWWLPYKDLAEEDWLASRTALFADRARRLSDELQRTEAALLKTQQQLYAKVPPIDRIAHLQALAGSDFPAVRTQAAVWASELLRESTGPEAKACADLLLQISRDGMESVQRQAVLALEKVDDPRAFDRLLQLLQLAAPPIRAAAARSLGRFGSSKTNIAGDLKKRTVLALEQALGDTSLLVVANAAESLGVLQAADSGPLMVGLLKHPDENVRQAAGTALEQMAGPSLLQPLLLALDDPSPGVRFSLVGALGKSASRDKLTDPQLAGLLTRLSQLLIQDADPGVRSRAATVLGDLGGPAELQLLWERVRSKEDNRVQLRAWSAMVEIFARSQSLPLLSQWDQLFSDLNEHPRRSQLYQELAERWRGLEEAKPLLNHVEPALVRAWLAERKWQAALPLAVELARKAQAGAEKQERLRWLLVAGTQALEDKKPAEVLRLLKEIETLLLDAKDLGAEFAELRRKAQEMADGKAEPAPVPAGQK